MYTRVLNKNCLKQFFYSPDFFFAILNVTLIFLPFFLPIVFPKNGKIPFFVKKACLIFSQKGVFFPNNEGGDLPGPLYPIFGTPVIPPGGKGRGHLAGSPSDPSGLKKRPRLYYIPHLPIDNPPSYIGPWSISRLFFVTSLYSVWHTIFDLSRVCEAGGWVI